MIGVELMKWMLKSEDFLCKEAIDIGVNFDSGFQISSVELISESDHSFEASGPEWVNKYL